MTGRATEAPEGREGQRSRVRLRRKWLWFGGVALVIVVAVGLFAAPLFLPEKAKQVDEAALEGEATLVQGAFRGSAGHDVSGVVRIIEVDGVHYLRFENYEQTQGPDVFVYLTPSSSPDDYDEIRAGVKIRLGGGADGGESTKEGSFNQRLPDDLDVSSFHGVGIWCDRFRVPFGYASLA